MDNLLKRLSAVIIRHHWKLLILLCLITIGLAYGATKLQINNDHATWLPKHDEVARLLIQVDDEFSSNVMVFTVIDFSDTGVFHPEALALIEKITNELDGMPELFNVTSITNIIDIKKTEDGIEVGNLMTEIPGTPEDLDALKHYVLSKEMYVNSIVSSDCTYAALMTNIESAYDEVVIAEKIFNKVDEIAGDRPHYFGGDPAINYYMNEYMIRDMQTLVPVMLVVMVFVLAFGLRRITGVVFPLTLVGISIVWTFGLMSIFLFPINILSPAVAVLLIALGSDYAVHIYNHYLKRGDVRESTSEIALPVIMSALTTIAGLLAFATTRIEVLQNFGIELAFGLGSACILSIVLLAIGIYLFRIRANPSENGSQDDQHVFSRIMVRTGAFVHDNAKFVLVAAFAGLLAMGYGILKIRTNIDFIGQLPKNSPPRLGCNILEDSFNGMYPFSLYFRGDIEDPAVMNRMNYFENFLRSEDVVGGITSIGALIAEENWLMNGVYAIPETREGIANLWFLLEGQEILKTFVKTNRDKALVNSIVSESSTGAQLSLARRLERFMGETVSPEIVTIDPGMLSLEERRSLKKLRLDEASRQLSWLSGFYDDTAVVEPSAFSERMAGVFNSPERGIEMAPVFSDVQAYLEEETIEVLPDDLIESMVAMLKERWDQRSLPETKASFVNMIVDLGIMDAEDAGMSVDGMLKRAGFSLRNLRVLALENSYVDMLSGKQLGDEHFKKRARGVLWELLSEKPVFFSRQAEMVPGIGKAVISSAKIRVDQAGMPETIRVVHRLLISSQIQSLIIASIVVLALVAITQRSLRRGSISLLSVIVPLEFILGFMGWKNIPLDLGTVLCGALIIGLGIDGSIHFLHYYHKLQTQGITGKRSLQLTMGHVGRAVLTANATTFCGFLVLLFSKTAAVRNFSLVNSIAIFLVTLSVLTLLPALITVLHVGNVQDSPERDRSLHAKKISTLEPVQVEQVLRKKKKNKTSGTRTQAGRAGEVENRGRRQDEQVNS